MGKKITVGLYGGSFNPVHIGHMILASFLTRWGYVDKVWLNLSPQNPLKNPAELLPDVKRLAMLDIAVNGAKDLDICDIELSMPRPSYTIRTLDVLSKRFQNLQFKLVIGSDNWAVFDKWRDANRILDEYGVIVYPRRGYPIDDTCVDGMEVVNAPMIEISSSFIRNAISRGRNVEYFLPAGVYKYIIENNLYVKNDQ